jgi:hypothetical protein
MMKTMILLLAIFVSACAQLADGRLPDKPKLIDPEQNVLETECNGFANELDVCYQAAKQACPSGYTVREWVRNYGSVTRKIIFKCN